VYLILGLASEIGEVCGVVKKFIRGDMDEDVLQERLTSETGDILWYMVMMMKYVIDSEITSEMEIVLSNRIQDVLTTEEIYQLIRISGSLVMSIQELKRETTILLIVYLLNQLAKITDLQVAMTMVTTKLSARKNAGTLHGDGEGVRDGKG
jgi:hypothetical protein